YHFIGSKAELFDTVVRMLVDDVRSRWSPPGPEEFSGDEFWARVDALLDEIATLTATPALQHLGRLFYLAGDPEEGGARAELMNTVRGWVQAVLEAGRASGAVRGDLPLDLQARVTFAVLRAIDEWALDEGPSREPGSHRAAVAASAPGQLLRRLLAA